MEGINSGTFELLIGFYKDAPASTTMLFKGKDAGIYMVATLPEFRKKGLAKIMLHKTHELALNAGYKKVLLHSTKEGFYLYNSLGYKTKGKLILFFLN